MSRIFGPGAAIRDKLRRRAETSSYRAPSVAPQRANTFSPGDAHFGPASLAGKQARSLATRAKKIKVTLAGGPRP